MASLKEKKAKAEADKKLAAKLGITLEELADRNVPDLGFDENKEKYFDYGERSFVVTIAPVVPDVQFTVFELVKKTSQTVKTKDNKKDKTANITDNGEIVRGKKTKSLPKPKKNDDLDKAAAALEEFKQLKKDLKAVIKAEKRRLELVLMTARCWSAGAWKQLFVEHPIMRPLGFGLVWGMYQAGELVQSFRYREDGLFYGQNGEEFQLPEGGTIGLIHPLELTKEERNAWRKQLEEDEIEQPIEQLDRKVYIVHKKEAGKKELVRFPNKLLLDWVFGDRLEKFGWNYGLIREGYYDSYYREDIDAGLCVELHTSGNTIWEDLEITLQGAQFYKVGMIDWETHIYNEKEKEKACVLQDVPARYFSEVVRQITEAAAESYLGDDY